jgi:choline-sulfatase
MSSKHPDTPRWRSEYEHVVLLSLDTLRSDGIMACPNKLWPRAHRVEWTPRTPVLDELATRSTWFTQCISAAPYTSASHASFLTGRWPARHGLYELFNHKLRGPTLFDDARRMGLRTVMKVDFPLMLGPELGFTRAVDHYLVEDDAAAIDLVTDRPSLALIHFGGIHAPYGFHNLRIGGPSLLSKVAELETRLGDHRSRVDPNDEAGVLRRYRRALGRLYAEEAYDELFSLYLEGIEHFLEHRFGPFLERLLDRLGRRRSLLALFGDHGEEFGPDAFGHQDSLAEGVLRVPLILHGADIPARQMTHRIRSIDLAPTVLQLMGRGATALARMDGVPLDGRERHEDRAYAQSFIADSARFVAHVERTLRTGRKTGSLPHRLYKEAVYQGGHKLTVRHCRYERLPDGWRLHPAPRQARLERYDPVTTAMHAASDPALAQELLRELEAYNATRRPGAPSPPDSTVRDRLRALGYDL